LFCFKKGCDKHTGNGADQGSVNLTYQLSFRDWHGKFAVAVITIPFCSPECASGFEAEDLLLVQGQSVEPPIVLDEVIEVHGRWVNDNPDQTVRTEKQTLSLRLPKDKNGKPVRGDIIIPTAWDKGTSQATIQLSFATPKVMNDFHAAFPRTLDILCFLAANAL